MLGTRTNVTFEYFTDSCDRNAMILCIFFFFIAPCVAVNFQRLNHLPGPLLLRIFDYFQRSDRYECKPLRIHNANNRLFTRRTSNTSLFNHTSFFSSHRASNRVTQRPISILNAVLCFNKILAFYVYKTNGLVVAPDDCTFF